MTNEYFNEINSIKTSQGVEKYISTVRQLLSSERDLALEYINNSHLGFPNLFTLRHLIDEENLYQELSSRNITALKLCARILKNKVLSAKLYFLSAENDETNYPVLLWIVNSGVEDDGIEDDFDQIVDGTCAMLISLYNEKGILKNIIDLIYKRSEKGNFTHDLIWALFSSENADVLKMISEHLTSENENEVLLSKKLLSNNSPSGLDNSLDDTEKTALWLEENQPYVYFTGQSFNASSCPAHYLIDLAGKYLRRPRNNAESVQASAVPLTETQRNRLLEFEKISEEQQFILAEYASTLYHSSEEKWREWMRFPVQKQLEIAQKNGGGAL